MYLCGATKTDFDKAFFFYKRYNCFCVLKYPSLNDSSELRILVFRDTTELLKNMLQPSRQYKHMELNSVLSIL